MWWNWNTRGIQNQSFGVRVRLPPSLPSLVLPRVAKWKSGCLKNSDITPSSNLGAGTKFYGSVPQWYRTALLRPQDRKVVNVQVVPLPPVQNRKEPSVFSSQASRRSSNRRRRVDVRTSANILESKPGGAGHWPETSWVLRDCGSCSLLSSTLNREV